MASSLYYTRRIKAIKTSPTFQFLSLLLFLVLSIRWVLRHNHDDAPTYATLHISVDEKGVDWFKLYYVTYVRTTEELCSALMVWSEIEQIGSRAQRMLFYPSNWGKDELDASSKTKSLTPRARLLRTAEEAYYVKLAPLDVFSKSHPEHRHWAGSFTKLLAFNLTEFNRVLVISPDSTVLQNLDELFLFPKSPVAMPWIYNSKASGEVLWGYSSQLLMVEPSTETFKTVEAKLRGLDERTDVKDTSLLLSLGFGGRQPLRIPQRPYHLPTSSFRLPHDLHLPYLTTYNTSETWDAERILSEAKLLQFDDIGVAKPWKKERKGVMNKYMPSCRVREGFGATECSDREVWLGVYRGFAARREAVCGVGFEVVWDDSEGGRKEGSVDGERDMLKRGEVEVEGFDHLD